MGPNGALIQGRDVNLITGGDLRNAGTLRAQNDLSATAGNIDNSGLIEAGNRLDLLASGSIRNDQGGIIAGREVSLSALTGDVINERTVTQHQSSYRGTGTTEAFADSAARIEAAQKLTVSAGRDVANIGGVIDSKGDLALQGGRDVLVSAAVAERGWTAGSQAYQTQTTQMGAEVVAGRDISVSAGRDISVVGSRIDARRDVTFEAGRDVGLVAAANEEHAYGKTKKVTFQDDKITQQATRVDAGGDLAINAGQDLRLVASQASAGDEAYLVAGDKLELLAANDSSYYLYDKKSKGSFGSKKTRRDEITDVTAVGSQISSGGDLTLLSGGDQTYQGAKLESGNDLAIVSGGAVTFDAVKDLHQESHEKSKGDLAWQSSKGKGQTDETVRQSQLVAQGNLAIKAVEGLKIDLKHIDQKTVSQTIDAMVQADPQLAWLKQMEQRGDVDWRRVQELHDSWKYSNSGLGVGAQLAIAIVVTYFTAGAASGAIATAGAGTSMAGATAAATATTSAGWLNAAGTAALSGVASNGAISTINNRGNLGMSSGRDLQRCAEGLCSRWHDCGADCRRLRQMDLDPDRHLDRSTEHRGRGARRRVGHLARRGPVHLEPVAAEWYFGAVGPGAGRQGQPGRCVAKQPGKCLCGLRLQADWRHHPWRAGRRQPRQDRLARPDGRSGRRKRSVAISVPEPWLRESTRRWWIASPSNTPACPSMTRRAC